MIIGHVKEIGRYPVKSMGGGQLRDCAVTERGIPGDRGWAVRDEEAKEVRGAKNFPVLMQCSAQYVDEPADGKVTQAEITLPDGAKVRTDDASVSQRLSEVIGRKVTLHSLRPASDRDHYRREAPLDEARIRKLLGRTADEPLPDLSTFPQQVLAELIEFTSPLGTYFDAFPLHVVTTGWLDDLSSFNDKAKFDRRRFRPNFVIEPVAGKTGRVELEWMGKTVRIGDVRAKIESPTMRCSMTMQQTGDLPKDPSVLRTIVRDSDQNLGVYASVAGPGSVKVGDPFSGGGRGRFGRWRRFPLGRSRPVARCLVGTLFPSGTRRFLRLAVRRLLLSPSERSLSGRLCSFPSRPSLWCRGPGTRRTIVRWRRSGARGSRHALHS